MLFCISGFINIIKTITAFTIAHSITLGLTVFELIRLPQGTVEALIALTIIYLALEITQKENSIKSPWIMAFAFGLLHGLGFASMFKLKGLEGTDYYLNLLSFNIGIELGLLITLLPLIILIPLFNRLSWYRILIAMPASIIIALFGVEMFIDRIL